MSGVYVLLFFAVAYGFAAVWVSASDAGRRIELGIDLLAPRRDEPEPDERDWFAENYEGGER